MWIFIFGLISIIFFLSFVAITWFLLHMRSNYELTVSISKCKLSTELFFAIRVFVSNSFNWRNESNKIGSFDSII